MKVKQTIQSELKNTPTGTPLAGRSVTLQLTSCQSDSAAEIVTGLYPAEVDQQAFQPEQGINNEVPAINETRVFVLSYKGQPLMPCSPRKARKLLKESKADVVSARPFFTIK